MNEDYNRPEPESGSTDCTCKVIKKEEGFDLQRDTNCPIHKRV